MKIGILTYHRAVNYGAVLQAYSLSNEIKKRFPFCEVEIIDFEHKKRAFFKKKTILVFAVKRSIREALQKYKQTIIFKKFVNKELILSAKSYSNELKLKKYIDQNIDILISGSDAVFNWNDIGIPNPYFLAEYKTKYKMSYAASSHLQKYYNSTIFESEYLKNSLCGFCYIGVRDDSTRNFVFQYIKDTSVVFHNCDPTIFLKLDFDSCNLQKKLKKHNFSKDKKTVFVMLMNNEFGRYVKKYFSKDYQIVSLMDYNEFSDIYLYDLNPFEWAHVLKYGDFLVTDYFHATIFALKNNIPVLSIDASKYSDDKYESKAFDLLYSRFNTPFFYINGNSLNCANGYDNFKHAISSIYDSFNIETIINVFKKEGKTSESFFTMLKSFIDNEC